MGGKVQVGMWRLPCLCALISCLGGAGAAGGGGRIACCAGWVPTDMDWEDWEELTRKSSKPLMAISMMQSVVRMMMKLASRSDRRSCVVILQELLMLLFLLPLNRSKNQLLRLQSRDGVLQPCHLQLVFLLISFKCLVHLMLMVH